MLRNRRRGSEMRVMRKVLSLTVLGWYFASVSSASARDFDPPAPNPREPVNYVEWVNKFAEEGVKENAYTVYLEAFSQLKEFSEGEWSNEGPAIHAWLDENKAALELFYKATQIKDFAFHWELPGGTGDERIDYMFGSVKIYWLRPWRDAANGLLAAGWRARSGGRQEVFVDDVLAVLRASQHLYGSLLLFGRLRAIDEATRVYRTLVMALGDGGDRDGLVAMIAPRLSKDDPPVPGLSEQIQMEKLTTWDFVQRLYVPDEEKPGELTLYHPMMQWFVDQGGRPFSPLMQLAQTRIGFEETVKTCNAYFDGMVRWCEIPYHNIKPQDRKKIQREMFDDLRLESRNPLGLMVMVPLVHPRNMNDRIAATRRATHLIIHVFDHRRQNGSFPKSLGELRVSNLAQLRMDPFSGGDFKYKQDGKSFSLYSLGHDLADDGGTHTPWEGDGDFVFWPLPK